jgi:hypothetical protein
LRALLAGEAPPVFTETIDEHLERVHQDPLALVEEREALEQGAARGGGKTRQQIVGGLGPSAFAGPRENHA